MHSIKEMTFAYCSSAEQCKKEGVNIYFPQPTVEVVLERNRININHDSTRYARWK